MIISLTVNIISVICPRPVQQLTITFVDEMAMSLNFFLNRHIGLELRLQYFQLNGALRGPSATTDYPFFLHTELSRRGL